MVVSHGSFAPVRMARQGGAGRCPIPRPASTVPASTVPASTRPASTGARRGRPGYDLESLLAVAVKLFNERGYDGTSMEDLSRRLGISKSAIYHHVPGKAELLRLAVNRALDGLFAEIDKLDAVDGRAIDRLEHLVRGSVLVLAEQLPFVTLLLRVRGNTPAERDALARRRQFDQLVTDLVTKAAAEGDLRPGRGPRDRGAAAVRHGQLAHRVVPPAGTGQRGRARRHGGDGGAAAASGSATPPRWPPHRPPDRFFLPNGPPPPATAGLGPGGQPAA